MKRLIMATMVTAILASSTVWAADMILPSNSGHAAK